jgi:hypothetical protein
MGWRGVKEEDGMFVVYHILDDECYKCQIQIEHYFFVCFANDMRCVTCLSCD